MTCQRTQNPDNMKVRVNILKKADSQQIGSFVTSAKDIQKAFYRHVRFLKYGVQATDCYYKLSNV